MAFPTESRRTPGNDTNKLWILYHSIMISECIFHSWTLRDVYSTHNEPWKARHNLPWIFYPIIYISHLKTWERLIPRIVASLSAIPQREGLSALTRPVYYNLLGFTVTPVSKLFKKSACFSVCCQGDGLHDGGSPKLSAQRGNRQQDCALKKLVQHHAVSSCYGTRGRHVLPVW